MWLGLVRIAPTFERLGDARVRVRACGFAVSTWAQACAWQGDGSRMGTLFWCGTSRAALCITTIAHEVPLEDEHMRSAPGDGYAERQRVVWRLRPSRAVGTMTYDTLYIFGKHRAIHPHIRSTSLRHRVTLHRMEEMNEGARVARAHDRCRPSLLFISATSKASSRQTSVSQCMPRYMISMRGSCVRRRASLRSTITALSMLLTRRGRCRRLDMSPSLLLTQQ